MKFWINIAIFLLFSSISEAQNHYWIFFKDKAGSVFNPYESLDPKAIKRREKHNASLYDYRDFPLNKTYVDSIKNSVISLNVKSRWFNAVSVVATEKQIEKIKNFSFVINTKEIVYQTVISEKKEVSILPYRDSLIQKWQTDTLGGKILKSLGYTGKGIRIAVFDAGFKHVNKLPEFQQLKILKTYDFTRKDTFVYSYDTHGTMVLACIGVPNIGLATQSEYLLARTEVKSEPFSEEENWLAAVEWAEKNGADIINSSLGYTHHRYYPYQMDGETSLVAQAANIAAQKGMLVINAMGNDGDNKWHVLSTPADADSVLSVGGISYQTDLHIYFSSYGPNSRCITKPNVCAPGEVISITKKGKKHVYGTSFSTPLISGYTACILQAFPNKKNWQIKNLIIKSSSLYPYYDYAHGYGVPNATNIFLQRKIKKTKFSAQKEIDLIKLQFYNIDTLQNNYLFYNISDTNGCILEYYVVDIANENYQIYVPVYQYPDKDYLVVNLFYKGDFKKLKFKTIRKN